METATRTRDPDAKPKGFLLPNGAVKKLQRPPPPQTVAAAAADEVLYRECLKNHAASLGGHSLDGCGEFMPSLAANSADPTSFKCAACGCHRNFHRRITGPHRAAGSDDGLEGEGERDGRDDGGEEGDAAACRRRSCSPPPQPYFSSAPHMLLALADGAPAAPPMAAVPPPRKRFRTKFSPEQKERMLELSERIGWRLQKRDERLVEEYCRGIGVGRDVFKVWMHNNKHHLFGSSGSRRGEAGNSAMDSPAAAGGVNEQAVEANGSGDSGDADGIDNGHVMNGSSSSS